MPKSFTFTPASGVLGPISCVATETGVLGIPGRAWARDVRAVVGLAGAARAGLDRLLPAPWGTTAGTSLGALVRARWVGVHRADEHVLDHLVAHGLVSAESLVRVPKPAPVGTVGGSRHAQHHGARRHHQHQQKDEDRQDGQAAQASPGPPGAQWGHGLDVG